MIKKYGLIVLISLCFGQLTLAQKDSIIVEADKLSYSFLIHISFFQSFNIGYEKQLKPMRSLETELAYIYSRFFAYDVRGVIWRNTYKFFTKQKDDGRIFIGPQLVLHYHRINHEAIFSHLNDTYTEQDDVKREKFRASLMLVLGREWILSDRFLLEINAGFGAKYDTVKISYDNVGDYESGIGTKYLRPQAGPIFLPDLNIAWKFKYNLNS